MTATYAVVVPTFNRARLIPETLDSLLAQTRPFDEVIVVDDGSTDDTSQVMASRYPGCRYIVLAHGKVQRARNTGIAAAGADWIVFCDSDDLLEPDYLAEVDKLIAANPQLEAVYSNHMTFGQRRFLLDDRFAAEPEFWADLDDTGTAFLGGGPGVAAKLVASKGLLWPTGLAVKRTFFDIIGTFDERMAGSPVEDLEFTLRVVVAAKAAFLKRPFAHLRQHELNESNVDSFAHVKGNIHLFQFALDNHPHARTEPFRQALVANLDRRRRHCLYEAFRRRDWQTVRSVAADLRGKPMPVKQRLKVLIAQLPESLSNALHRVLQPMMSEASDT